MSKILATTPAKIEYNDLFLTGGTYYFADSLLCVDVYSGQQSIIITDLTNAMKPGKTCQRVKFSGVWNSSACEVANLLRGAGGDLRRLFALLAGVEGKQWDRGADVELLGVTGTAYNSQQPSNRVYSPFAKLNRLPAAPAKWTLAHVVRALVNGQFSELECRGKYSDDYAWDAATNFGKGALTDASDLIQELVEDKSGWWVSARDGGSIVVGCHSFKSYGFTLDLGGHVATPATIEPTAPAHSQQPEQAPTNPAPVVAEIVEPVAVAMPDADECPAAQRVARFCERHPLAALERHACGNMLVSLPFSQDGAWLRGLDTLLTLAGVLTEIEAEGDALFLAVYVASQKPQPEPTPPGTDKPTPEPVLSALAAVMQVSHPATPPAAVVADEQPRKWLTSDEVRVNKLAEIATAEAIGYPIPGLYKLAERAYSNVSFSPEKRALSHVRENQAQLAAEIARIEAAGREYGANPERIAEVVERYKTGFIKRLTNWLGAKSRCISSMITGGSNFPVRRAEKANNSEHNRMLEFMEHYEKNLPRAIRSLKPAPVRPASATAPEAARPFELNGQAGEIVVNPEVDRVQLIFDSKPDANTITQLKSNGFRWSPRFGAWQRQDTENGRHAVRRLTGVDMRQPVAASA